MDKIKPCTWIKIVIVVMMLLCLCPMPYGFYNLVRFCSMIGFGILSYVAYNDRSNSLAITYGALALMFQPFIMLTLGRDVWTFVDVAVAVFLIILMVRNKEVNLKELLKK